MKMITCLGWLTILTYSLPIHASGAHVHGQAYMNIVSDGDKLVIHAQMTAHDVVGFERKADSETEQLAIQNALKSLNDVAQWLTIEGSECSKSKVEIHNPFAPEVEDHDHDASDAEHENHKHGHNDFELDIEYSCQNLDKLSGIQVNIMDIHDHIHDIEVQWFIKNQQGLMNLTADNSTVRFE